MRRTGPSRAAALSAAVSVFGVAGAAPVLAQTAPPAPSAPAVGADGTTTFPAGFFVTYNPITAADMVARVPGFELRDGDDRRGFGATAGNLLINGERPSSKTAAADLLKRIPAGNVLRIELISGNNAAVDVRGQSQVVNVVVNQANRAAASTSYTAGLRYIQYSNRIGWVLQASHTMRLSPTADLSADIQVPNTLGRGVVNERLVNGAGMLTGTRFQLGIPNNIGVTGAAALRWRPTADDTVNFNLQLAPTWNDTDTIQEELAASGAPRSLLIGRTEFNNNYTAEFGADWEHRFSPTLSAKLITLVSNASVDQSDVFQIQTFPASFLTRTQDRTTDSGERIARARLKWTLSQAHTLEFGGEGAFNYRDTTLDIVNTPRGGVPTPVALAVSDARVEEVRGEAFITDIWTVSPQLTIESGLNVETSRIRQTGDQRKQRSFRFVKPRASATYALSSRSNLRLSLTRDVAQLDFAEFASAIDFVNASTIQGNPDLAPEKAWKGRIEFETQFAPRAALTIAAFADRVEDVKDLVDLAGFDAYGNIGNGSRVGAEIRASVPLTSVGLPGAELRFNGLYQRTRVTDPITGEKRQFSVPVERQGSGSGAPVLNAGNKRWAYVVNFRQNLPDLQASWGVTAVQWSGRYEYRRAERFYSVRNRPRLDVFVESTAVKPVTLRAFVNNILSTPEDRTRTFFVRDRSTGTVQRAEFRTNAGGPEGTRAIGFQVSGRF